MTAEETQQVRERCEKALVEYLRTKRMEDALQVVLFVPALLAHIASLEAENGWYHIKQDALTYERNSAIAGADAQYKAACVLQERILHLEARAEATAAILAAARSIIDRHRWVEIWDRHLDRTFVYPSITDAHALEAALTVLETQAGEVTG